MQDRLLYEYAVLRLVPRVEREEFINIGVVLFCKRTDYLKCKIEVKRDRALALFPNLDLENLACYLSAFEKIVAAHPEGGLIATYDAPSRFRWLTAKRSTIVQISAIHSGLSENLDATLESLFQEFV
mgnify:FL=1